MTAGVAVAPLAQPKEALRKALLEWYDAHARVLPWRVGPQERAAGRLPDPYRVWLSEVMLQQTTVAAVIPHYQRFLAAFPTLEALAAASREDVLRHWAGLGYYSRGRHLHAAAQQIASAGAFPTRVADWRALPGVGPYTAAAITAICFDADAPVVDGNVERVLARLAAVQVPMPALKPHIRALAECLTAPHRAGDYAQALMDLGAGVCTPRAPRCQACPLAFACLAAAQGIAERLPVKRPKPPKPTRYGAAFFLERQDQVWLVRRPARGLLAGMPGLPSGPWVEGRSPAGPPAFSPSPSADWRLIGAVTHVFTHFALELSVWRAQGEPEGQDGFWQPFDRLDEAGLPSIFAKAAALALGRSQPAKVRRISRR